MFGAFLFGSRIYADTFIAATPGVYNLSESVTMTDNSPELTVIFVLNEFVFNSDLTTSAPDRIISDRIRLNDWLTVKPKATDSAFQD
jgi:hypothetical protein